MKCPLFLLFLALALSVPTPPVHAAPVPESQERLRLIIETDAGGDPDDEQSLVRFLLYANEWDVEGIVCNRPEVRDGENLNPERTGLGVVRALIEAYGKCRANLVLHDPRYPEEKHLWERTVPGDGGTERAVELILAAVDSPDPRPLWYCDWGSDHGSGENNLKRALDRVLRERGPEGYARFKDRLRLSSHDAFGDHTRKISPPFRLWVDTYRPELNGRRWYHRFSALTAKAGGFDLERDVRAGHGPLGALYPVNTTSGQKEGDSMTFLHLVPTGMNDPSHPGRGSWAGRYGINEEEDGQPYYWANQSDTWNGSTGRDATLARWAVHLQNDFKARMDWCVTDFAGANHPPRPRLKGEAERTVPPGREVILDAGESDDPDSGQSLNCRWSLYPEAGTYREPAPELTDADTPRARFTVPRTPAGQTLHFILEATDTGSPPLTRCRRVIITVKE